MKIKRFIVFSYCEWDEYGGWDDFCTSFDTLDEAKVFSDNESPWADVVQIVDLETGEIVNEN